MFFDPRTVVQKARERSIKSLTCLPETKVDSRKRGRVDPPRCSVSVFRQPHNCRSPYDLHDRGSLFLVLSIGRTASGRGIRRLGASGSGRAPAKIGRPLASEADSLADAERAGGVAGRNPKLPASPGSSGPMGERGRHDRFSDIQLSPPLWRGGGCLACRSWSGWRRFGPWRSGGFSLGLWRSA